MASRTIREAERNIRSNDFLQANQVDFTGNAYMTTQIAALKMKIDEAGDSRGEQISHDGGARQKYDIAEDANEALKTAMREIADFAATMGDVIEGVEEKFRVTRTGGKRARIARARAFAADALPHKDIFVGRGLDEDFIEDLLAKTDALETALAGAVAETAKRVGLTEKAVQAHKDANQIIKNVDPIVRRRYRDDTAKLAQWNFATHVERDPESKPKPPPANPPA